MLEEIGDHQPFKLIQSGANETGVGAADRGILAEAEKALQVAGKHRVREREEGVAFSLKATAKLRQVGEVEFVLLLGVLAPPCFQ